MKVFAIGDLHFGFGVQKPMDIFGKQWANHAEKIITNWKQTVSQEDTVLLPGDISWGMRLQNAKIDLDIIDQLPGKKILLSGNHDYWWDSPSKLSAQYPNMVFLQNTAFLLNHESGVFICGCKGAICPNDVNFLKEHEKLYHREQIRLRLSLDAAMRAGAKQIIVMMHYPPVNEKHEISAFVELFLQYPVHTVVYGHLHGAESHTAALQGTHHNICYHLVSSDYLQFVPKRIV